MGDYYRQYQCLSPGYRPAITGPPPAALSNTSPGTLPGSLPGPIACPIHLPFRNSFPEPSLPGPQPLPGSKLNPVARPFHGPSRNPLPDPRSYNLAQMLRCPVCGKDTFGTIQALASHQSALAHYECSQSRTTFKSAEELRLHNRLEYTVLSKEEHAPLYERLLENCHPVARLRSQGYRLTVEPPPPKPRRKPKKDNEDEKDLGKEKGCSGKDEVPKNDRPEIGGVIKIGNGKGESAEEDTRESLSEERSQQISPQRELIAPREEGTSQFEKLPKKEDLLEFGSQDTACAKRSSSRDMCQERLTQEPFESSQKENLLNEKDSKDPKAAETPLQAKPARSQKNEPPGAKDLKNAKWLKKQVIERPPVLFTRTPQSVPGWQGQKRRAIAVDCEMVGVAGGYIDELAFLSAVDFFTGEVLINNFVKPTRKVTDWRSRVSGVTATAMANAVATGQALLGWASAREALWHYADTETILIGHSLKHDLNALQLIHSKIVDAAILSSEAVFSIEGFEPDPKPGAAVNLAPGADAVQDPRLKHEGESPEPHLQRVWALKTLAYNFLNRRIQMGKKGHNCLEDTFATRDVVIWCLRKPSSLAAWAHQARTEHETVKRERREKEEKEKMERKEKEEIEKARQAKEKEATEQARKTEAEEIGKDKVMPVTALQGK
ncbi:hypothetical protein BJY04DRAFT_221910 [Aspergillus karnatakaensis]|uniref:uncharacterized protein n=1 Tax=Aspergillus karnatakaensis TaxID=1810916 RepID=UPI003CCDED57